MITLQNEMKKLLIKSKLLSILIILNFFFFSPVTAHNAQPPGSGMSNAIDVSGSFTNGIFSDTKNNNPANGFGNNYSNSATSLYGQASHDIWYKFTINADVSITISLCGSGGLDTYLHLLNNAGTEIARNDDNGPICSGSASSLQTSISAGTYFVVVEGYGSSYGDINTQIIIPQDFLVGGPDDINTVNTILVRELLNTTAQIKLSENDNTKVNVSIQYLDQFGRVVQNVDKSQTPNGKDLILPHQFDNLHRETKNFLPYAYINATAGSYRPNAITEQQAYYNNPGNNTTPNSAYAYAEVMPEKSPLSRVFEKGAVGQYGQLSSSGVTGSGHTLRYNYDTNNDIDISDVGNTKRVVHYEVTISSSGERILTYSNTGNYYYSNDLFLQVIKNENWIVSDGRAGTVEVFSNKEGKEVLRRSYNKNAANAVEILSTYYVYDDFGNLCFVLPPAANPDAVVTTTPILSTSILSQFCYQYLYDEKQRLTAKRLPSKEWEYVIYNQLDKVVARQDGNQRLKNEWSIIKYDGLGRIIITGLWNNANTAIERATLQTLVNGQSVFYETRASGADYTAQAWPQTITKYLSINYYDNYAVPGLPSTYLYQAYAGNTEGFSKQTESSPTVSKTWPLSSTTDLWLVKYYDSRGNVIQLHSTNHIGGKEIVNTEFNFNDQITKVVRQHSSTSGTVNVTSRYVYDHHGREIEVYNKIGSAPEVLVCKQEYNELGQLIDKKLHRSASSTKFLQSVDYRYDVRGNLIAINDPISNLDNSTESDVDKFTLSIKYETATVPSYNSNIGSIQWQTGKPASFAATTPLLKYDFRYDKLDRLVDAVTSEDGVKNNYFNEHLRYDKMGNIASLGRYAKLAANSSKTQVDSLTYTYAGNQLTRVDDGANNIYGFTENVNNVNIKQSNEFTYDANGNQNKDLNKGITSITYNIFDLPVVITKSNGSTVTYEYDGLGNKLRKTLSANGSTFVTDYIDGIQYDNNQISFIATEEGVARKNGANYTYQYALKNHLGSTCVIIQPNSSNPEIADVIQVSNYYPYGLEFRSDLSTALYAFANGDKNNYLYNDKEYQTGIDTYDFGARHYDAATGRWTVPDPLNQSMSETPYAAMGNNPMSRIDPDGRFWHVVAGAVIGGVANLAIHAINGKINSIGDGFAAFGIGATAGAVTAFTGGAGLAAVGGSTGLAAIGNAAAVGAYSAAVGGYIQGVGNLAYFGDKYEFADFFSGAVLGAAFSGAGKAIEIAMAADEMMPISQGMIDEATKMGDEITVTATPGRGFSSFSAFKRAMGNAGEGKAWHHIVEQTKGNVEKFGEETIHNTRNLMRLPHGAGTIHNKISAYYSSKDFFTNGLTVRQWLSTQTYQQQYDFGIKQLVKFGWKQ